MDTTLDGEVLTSQISDHAPVLPPYGYLMASDKLLSKITEYFLVSGLIFHSSLKDEKTAIWKAIWMALYFLCQS